MIDISDVTRNKTRCDQSSLGIELYEDKITIDPTTYQLARDFDLDPTLCALSGGEDYELLFSISMADYEKIKSNQDLTVIGHFTAHSAGMNMITKSGSSVELKAQGWDGMKGND